MSTAAAALPSGSRHTVLKVAAVLLIGLKLYSLLAVNLVSDEAYYWMWGQHPALSYFDHPGLNAWLIGIADALFGRGVLQLRLWTIPTFTVSGRFGSSATGPAASAEPTGKACSGAL